MNEKEALHYMIDNPGKVVVGPKNYRIRATVGAEDISFWWWNTGATRPGWFQLFTIPVGEYRVEEEEAHDPQVSEVIDATKWIERDKKALKDLAAAILRKVERMIEEKAGE